MLLEESRYSPHPQIQTQSNPTYQFNSFFNYFNTFDREFDNRVIRRSLNWFHPLEDSAASTYI